MGLTSFSCGPNGLFTVADPRLKRAVRIALFADWHSAHDDERGNIYRQYSCRMAQWHHPMEGVLDAMLKDAADKGAEAAFFAGDMISFPTEKGVEILHRIMENSPIPCYYISGNHDWHYEGLPGSDLELRREWTAKRLMPLFGGRNSLMYAVRLADLKILMMDNSPGRILPEQLCWLRQELEEDTPAVLCIHVPLYIPGMGQEVTHCMCHPDWGWASDPYFEIERRERWPKSGVDDVTRAFAETVWSSGNLLGILCGHTHLLAGMAYRGKVQIVAQSGMANLIDFNPA